MVNQEYLVSLTIAPELEEAIVDFLLTFESENGFKSYEVNSHHHINTGLSLAEQVSGRQNRICFEIYLQDHQHQEFIDQLRQKFTGAAIEYRVLPVIDSGLI
jgi:hypothetical protein